jgi:DNA-binding transcriptional regulator YiaG
MPEKLDQHNIKDLRARAKMSQQALADSLGVTRMTIIRWEQGQSKPSALACRQLHRLHKKLDGK